MFLERLLTRLITGRQKQSGSRAALFAFRVNAIVMFNFGVTVASADCCVCWLGGTSPRDYVTGKFEKAD
jgi:hypothetical protein